MKAVTSGNFLKEFTVIADCACDKKERFVVQRSNGKNVVLMSMEDFVENALFDRGDLKEERLAAAQMASIKVTFQLEFEDGPVEPEEERAILKEVFEDEVIVPSTEWE